MTVAARSPLAQYMGNAVSSQFGAPFRYNLVSDLVVQAIVAGVVSTLNLNVDYTATSGPTDAGGTVTMTTAPAVGTKLRIRRKSARNQADLYPTSGNFPAITVETDLDRAMLIDQEQDVIMADLTARALLVPDGETLVPLPAAALRAGNALGFGADGSPVLLPVIGQTVPDGALLTFAAIAFSIIPLGTDMIRTSGRNSSGDGSTGVFISDPLATAALASACPQLCTISANGRYFRLLPQGGMIAISQAGARGGMNNDQPAVQAALIYCAAIGCRLLLFDFDTVSIWNTVRTSAAAQTSTAPDAQDGQSIWVTAPIKFLGLPTMTHIKMLSITGASLETGWQNVGGNLWRGSGINLMGGTQGAPNANNLTLFAMENIWLDGGCAYTGARTAVTPASPDGPDLTNKGIRLQGTQCDTIILNNCIISGFKGEATYFTGTTVSDIWLYGVKVFGSNQSSLNSSAGNIRAENCEFGGSYITAEVLGRNGGRYVACKFYNSSQTSFTGGPANGLLYNYAYPTRDLTKAPPWLDLIDCEFLNAGQFLGGNYLRIIRGRATDTSFYLTTAISLGSLTSTYIDLEYTIDQANQNPIFAISGPPTLTTVIPGAPAGTYIAAISDLHIRVNVHRTALAIANSREAISVFQVLGCIDPGSCSLAIGEADGIVTIHVPNIGGATVNIPLMTCDGPSNSQNIGAGTPLALSLLTMTAGPYAVPISSPRHGLQNTGASAAIACTMATTYTYAFGQKGRIYWYGSTAGTTFTFAQNATGLRLKSACTLSQAFDWLELEFNGATGLWHEIARSVL